MYNHVKREARQYFILLRGLLVLSLEAIYRIQLKGCSNISTFLSRCCQDTESILELSSSVVYFCRAARLPWCPTCHDAMSGSRYISLKINEPVNFTKLLMRCFEYWNKTKVEMFSRDVGTLLREYPGFCEGKFRFLASFKKYILASSINNSGGWHNTQGFKVCCQMNGERSTGWKLSTVSVQQTRIFFSKTHMFCVFIDKFDIYRNNQ